MLSADAPISRRLESTDYARRRGEKRWEKRLVATGTGVLFACNALWFGVGAWYFGVAPAAAARLLAPRSARDAPLVTTVAAAVRFLGGLNLAFAALAALLVVHRELVPAPAQRALFAAVVALAHATQVGGNLAALGGGPRGEALWPVRTGPMRVIVAGDLAPTVANAALAVGLLARTPDPRRGAAAARVGCASARVRPGARARPGRAPS